MRLVLAVKQKGSYSSCYHSRYEGDCVFCWVDGSEPDMPVWDDNKGGWVPQASDTREQIEWDQTFAVAPGEVVTVENKIAWVRPTARANIVIAGTLYIRNSLLLWDQTEHQPKYLYFPCGVDYRRLRPMGSERLPISLLLP
jgi:hypothetical protein